ncbi:Hypothetical predicted protein [Pelobates cultripes]|uniref:Uncharacterized protein n=1 Tax=Pelobates cultripes TaxID=61616 RepID=A0AAD1RRZ0_PELCU|nr:Hypothetical predicted protein [Pelobates cultripes]
MAAKLQNNLQQSFCDLCGDIQELGTHTSMLENKMADHAETHNALTSEVRELRAQMESYESKLADVKDWSTKDESHTILTNEQSGETPSQQTQTITNQPNYHALNITDRPQAHVPKRHK